MNMCIDIRQQACIYILLRFLNIEFALLFFSSFKNLCALIFAETCREKISNKVCEKGGFNEVIIHMIQISNKMEKVWTRI